MIARSPDLRRLQEEGYDLEVRTQPAFLLVHNVPYLNAQGKLKRGVLVMPLKLEAERAGKPPDHVALWQGETPVTPEGNRLPHIINDRQDHGSGLVTDHQMSSKPKPSGEYANYYDKVTTYVAIIGAAAHVVDPKATAINHRIRPDPTEPSVFAYADSATSLAGIGTAMDRLRGHKIAIVGLGGTGSYVLDLVAKTPVAEIHLFDGDLLYQHNAFRSPGAASLEDLEKGPSKVDYYKDRYSKIHLGIQAHPEYVTATNVEKLRGMAFVFLTMEGGEAKRLIVDHLVEWGVPFVDVGIGVFNVDNRLGGAVRVTFATPAKHDHLTRRISFGDPDQENQYGKNIQVADVNMLNASLAVIRWKKLIGFYHDLEHEHNSVYEIEGNHILNEDAP